MVLEKMAEEPGQKSDGAAHAPELTAAAGGGGEGEGETAQPTRAALPRSLVASLTQTLTKVCVWVFCYLCLLCLRAHRLIFVTLPLRHATHVGLEQCVSS